MVEKFFCLLTCEDHRFDSFVQAVQRLIGLEIHIQDGPSRTQSPRLLFHAQGWRQVLLRTGRSRPQEYRWVLFFIIQL